MFAQSEESGPDFTTAELALFVVNAGNNDITKFTLSSLDAAIYCNNVSGCSISVAGQSHYNESISVQGSLECNKVGFHSQECTFFVTSNAACSPSISNGAKPLKKGYFKLTISVKKENENDFTEKAYLYYDNRDSRFPSGAMNNCGACSTSISNDLTVKYNHTDNMVSIKIGNGNFSELGVAKVLTIEQLNQLSDPCYENYEARYFAALTSITRSQGNNPVINWSAPYGSEYDFDHYRIERSVNGGTFEFVDYIYNEQTTSYTDATVWWDPNTQGEIELTYRILTYYESEEIYHYSNQKSILVTEEYPQKKYQAGLTDAKPEVTVSPNPFNSSTMIRLLNIPISAEIKVVDLLGREYRLTEQIADQDQRQLLFDGIDLSSGIYFVVVRDNTNIYTNKIVLLK